MNSSASQRWVASNGGCQPQEPSDNPLLNALLENRKSMEMELERQVSDYLGVMLDAKRGSASREQYAAAARRAQNQLDAVRRYRRGLEDRERGLR